MGLVRSECSCENNNGPLCFPKVFTECTLWCLYCLLLTLCLLSSIYRRCYVLGELIVWSLESNRSMDLTTVRSVYTINHSCRFLWEERVITRVGYDSWHLCLHKYFVYCLLYMAYSRVHDSWIIYEAFCELFIVVLDSLWLCEHCRTMHW